jgi:DNA polymerase III epsilon subunit-like protein
VNKRIVVLDFETFYQKKVYDLQSMNITTYVCDPRFQILGMAYRFLDDERTHWLEGEHAVSAWIRSVDWINTVVVGHNVKFDGAILAWHFKVKPYLWIDTMALAKAVIGQNTPSHSLKRLAEYLGLPAKGDIEKDDLAEYCKNDAEICKGIYEKLITQFPASQLWHLDWTIRAFVEPRLVLDIAILEKGVQDEKRRRQEVIKKSGVDKTVLSSNKQFAALLAKRGYEVPTKVSTRTGNQIPAFARTDDGLSILRESAPDLYAARIASKSNLLETRGEALLAVAKTDSFPFDVNFSGAEQTHRYSGGSGAGGNPQNFTCGSFLRRAVCTSSNQSLIVGDFAAIELRILAWLAQEPRLMGKIMADEDVYADFASLKYGRKITKENKAERKFGKCSILGLGYNMGAKKFKLTVKTQTGMDISEDEAWETVNLYRITYFNVPKLWEKAHALLPLIASGKVGCMWFAPFIKIKKGSLVLPSGLEIKYPNLRQVDDEWVYDVYKKVYEPETTKLYGGKIVENICQALAGELCKEAIERAERCDLKIVGQIHDEIISVVPKDDMELFRSVEECAELLKACMEQSPKWMPTLRLRAEVGIGNSWEGAKA